MNTRKLSSVAGILLLLVPLAVVFMLLKSTNDNSASRIIDSSLSTTPTTQIMDDTPLTPPGSTTNTQGEQAQYLHNLLYKQQGVVIAHGIAKIPGNLINSYQLEEVVLPAYTTFRNLDGKEIIVNKFWRLSVVGGPFTPSALRWELLLDGVPLLRKDTLDTLVGAVFDPSLIHERASIGVSYGMVPPKELLGNHVPDGAMFLHLVDGYINK